MSDTVSVAVHVGLHDLSYESVTSAMIHPDGTVSVCIGDARVQLHWPSVRALNEFIDRINDLVAHAEPQRVTV